MRNSLIIQRDPFREFESFLRQTLAPVETVNTAFSPAADVHREGDDAVIRLELPGLDIAKDVTVEVVGRDLVVSGERRDERSEESEGRRLQEIRYGSFRRSFTLGRPLTADAVSASYDAGVLTVRIAGAYGEVSGQKVAITEGTSPVVEGESTEATES